MTFEPGSTESELMLVNTIFGKLYTRKGDMITGQLLEYSAHTRNEIAMLTSFLEPGQIIFDIGAHIGTFTIPFAKAVGPSGRVYSFEADYGNYSILKKNIAVNGVDEIVSALNSIVSANKCGFTKALADANNSGTYFFSPVTSEVSSDTTIIDEWRYAHQDTAVPNLIKIDVEGAERLVLESCKNTLAQTYPTLYIEIVRAQLAKFNTSPEAIQQMLSSLGYHFFKNDGPRNSSNDNFRIVKLEHVSEGGNFFDLLAVHSSKLEKFGLNYAHI